MLSNNLPPPVEDIKVANQTFNQAFAAARKTGVKTFTWNNKLYGTTLASDTTVTPVAPKVVTKPKPKPKEVVKKPSIQLLNFNKNIDYGAESFKPRLNEFLESKPKPKPELRNIKSTFKVGFPLALMKILTPGLRNTRR